MVATMKPQADTAAESVEINVLYTEVLALSIQQARSKMPGYMQEFHVKALMEKHAFINRLKFYLARNISRIIAENDKNLVAVFKFNPANNPNTAPEDFEPADPSIHLILHTTKQTSGLESLLESLNETLTNELRVLLPEKFSHYESVLDFSYVTDKDIENKKGYAAVLNALHAPPLKVWPH